MATSAEATRPADQITFAHNSERQFARLLDFYRVEWEYEPTAFPIEWDAAGRPVQHFRPDFYLPTFGLYIEITTLNQRLVTKKNRKVRRLRELYPDVRIRVLYQRDYLSLLAKYGLEPPSQMTDPPPGEADAGSRGARADPRSGWPSARSGRPGGPVGRWSGRLGGRSSGRGRRGGREWCPTRHGRCRRYRPTPSWSGWPRSCCRPSAPPVADRPPPSGPADDPGAGEALQGLGGRWFNRRALAGPRGAGQSAMDS
jgi:hypothetical protein